MTIRDVEVRLARPDDAVTISSAIRRCYGETYCWTDGLDPALLARRLGEGALAYALATGADGAHAGQVALERSEESGVFEHGRAIVEPAFRNRGVFAAMDRLLLGSHATAAGAKIVLGRAVTSHVYSQRHCLSSGFVPLGLLLGLYPGDTIASGFGAVAQPLSAVLMGLALDPAPRPRRLTLAGTDRDRALAVLEALGMPTGPGGSRPPASNAPLGARLERDPKMGLVRLRFTAGGPERRFDPGFVDGLAAAGTRVLWADVPSEHPGAPTLVSELRAMGLGYAAYVPLAGPQGEDVLRFQCLLDPAPLLPEAILVTDEVVALRDEVMAEALTPLAVS